MHVLVVSDFVSVRQVLLWWFGKYGNISNVYYGILPYAEMTTAAHWPVSRAFSVQTALTCSKTISAAWHGRSCWHPCILLCFSRTPTEYRKSRTPFSRPKNQLSHSFWGHDSFLFFRQCSKDGCRSKFWKVCIYWVQKQLAMPILHLQMLWLLLWPLDLPLRFLVRNDACQLKKKLCKMEWHSMDSGNCGALPQRCLRNHTTRTGTSPSFQYPRLLLTIVFVWLTSFSTVLFSFGIDLFSFGVVLFSFLVFDSSLFDRRLGLTLTPWVNVG